MRKQESFLYDVFISYSSADQSWVTQWLLPHLERAGLRVAIDFRDFVVGAPRLEEVQRFVTQSHFVITVLTPAWQESEWNEFATLLGRTLDPAARRRKLLPLVLQPTPLPPLLLAPRLEVADFTTEAKRPQELARLLRTIQQTIPPRVWPDGPELTPPLWWRWWLRYHHRQLRLGGALVVVLLLTLMMAARIAPFQDRLVWLADSAEFPNAVALHSTGTTLIVGAENVLPGCHHAGQGLWYRPLAANGAWQLSTINADLCIPDWSPPSLSNIVALAAPPHATRPLYALTSHSGILVSTTDGASFDAAAPAPPLGNNNMAAIFGVTVGQPASFWVGGETGALWRFHAGQWQQLDGVEGGCTGLPAVTVKSLLMTEQQILIGTDRQGLWRTDPEGAICQAVFDLTDITAATRSRYEFRGLVAANDNPPRYLALVRDWMGGDAWQLLDLCAHRTACTHIPWTAEPLWTGAQTVGQVLVQEDGHGGRQWYVATEWFAQVWYGDLQGRGERAALPRISHCLFDCRVAMAPGIAGASPSLLAQGRVYTYAEGRWWHRVWP